MDRGRRCLRCAGRCSRWRGRQCRRWRRCGRWPGRVGRDWSDQVDRDFQLRARLDSVGIFNLVFLDDFIHGAVKLIGNNRQGLAGFDNILDDRAAAHAERDRRLGGQFGVWPRNGDLIADIDRRGWIEVVNRDQGVQVYLELFSDREERISLQNRIDEGAFRGGCKCLRRCQ